MKTLIYYILNRLAEPSTWATIVGFVSAQLHLTMNQELNTWAIQLGVILATGAGILIKEGGVSNIT